MDNPNPIFYRDLVTPDNSITDLIAQLTTLIGQYDQLKSKVQSDAATMAASLKNVTSATDEQRKQIESATKQSDELAMKYANITEEQRKQQRVLLTLKQAQKEKNDIDKLVVRLATSQEGSYNRLSAQYRLNKIRLNEMSEAERHGTEAGRQLETETRKIYERMSELQKATGKYTLEVGHYENAVRALPGPIREITSGFSNMGASLKAIGGSDLTLAAKGLKALSTIGLGTVTMLISLTKYLTGAARTMRDFEQANADLSTILGVNVKDMEALTNTALSLGRSTEYTASQVTQLQTELAKLGFGQGSIISMQKSVLQFATAVGANLGEAAEVAGSTLRAFNLTSKDTDEVLATLAVATNNSALSFEKIRTSIGTVFPVANAYGLTVKDTTALLGALANAGFDASSAATATRNILLNLANANGKLAKSLGGSVSTFDDIIDGLVKLRQGGIDVAEALELTDKRSVAAFSAFISGAEQARELHQSLEDVSGELERIQSERLNTTEGATKLLQSAWEGLTLAFSKSNGVIKETIDWLTKLVTKTQELLFPEETATSEFFDKYSEQIREVYKERGEEAAKAYADEIVRIAQQQTGEIQEQETFIGRWFGIGKKHRLAKEATGWMKGIQQAAQTVTMEIANDTEEQVRQAAQQAEQEAAAAQEKAEELTKEQKKAIEAAKKQRIADRQAVVDAINLEIAVTEKGTDKMLELRLDKVNAERQLELERNRQKTVTERQEEAAINAKYDKEILDVKTAYYKEVSQIAVQSLQAELNSINLQIAVTEKGTEEMLRLKLAAIDKQRAIELEQNRQLDDRLKQDEAAINAKYDKQIQDTTIDYHTQTAMEILNIEQDLKASEFDLEDRNERQKTQFRLKMEKERLQKILDLNRENGKELTKEQRQTILNTIEAIDKESKRVPYDNLYEVLGIGLDSEQQDALNTAIDSVVDSINSAIDAWMREADAAINAANARVEAARTALDAEIEARNNGYANNVQQAQKELDFQQQQQEKALQQKEKAQKAQLALDTATQASSLVTASANIWASLSAIPYVGPALAAAALITMWGSFAAAKVKAVQATKQETYGEGTVELLEGGSHASGHDIDLGRKKDGTRRRAEGGEYFAVINKRNSRRYGSVIPDVINSFNDGTFAEKYQRANANMSQYAVTYESGADLSRLERDVRAIKEQGNDTRYTDEFGNVIIKHKNLTTKIYAQR